jgi:putative ABC transport system substrate-binding protein
MICAMLRRSLISKASGAALAAALPAWAQQSRPARIGVLVLANWERPVALIKDGLRELGYVEGRNLAIELRSAQGRPDALDVLAAELVGLKVDVIVTVLTPAVVAAKRATGTIPIVMAGVGDPVGTGIVASLARPGGNITGMSTFGPELASKTLEFMRELRPGTSRVAVLANATDPFTRPLLEQLQAGAKALRMELLVTQVRSESDYEAAFLAWTRQRVDAVFVQSSLQLRQASELALQHRLPTYSSVRSFVDSGGLLTYTASEAERYQRTAWYVDRILKGARPADLPVERPTRFELVINGRTAKALGIAIPQTVLLRATEVIE